MARQSSKVMSTVNKRTQVNLHRGELREARDAMKPLKAKLKEAKTAVTAANKAARSAQSEVNKQQKVIDKVNAKIKKLQNAA